MRSTDADTALCSVFGIQPQFDTQGLLAETQSIVTSLSHLVDDIQHAYPRTRVGRSLVAETTRVQQFALLLKSEIARGASYDEVVKSLHHFHEPWRTLAAKVRRLDDHHLQRLVHHIDHSSRIIHELLWLTEAIDYGQLAYLAKALEHDVDVLFDTVSLNVLLELPAGRNVLPIAGEFYGLCENFLNRWLRAPPKGNYKATIATSSEHGLSWSIASIRVATPTCNKHYKASKSHS